VAQISATDGQHPTRVPRQGNTVGLYLSNGSPLWLKAIFDKLAVSADPDLLDELRDLPFGSYGHLADRYGVHWFFRASRPSRALRRRQSTAREWGADKPPAGR
jgi:uncharacterized glyoxalase superfamily protein PhnB